MTRLVLEATDPLTRIEVMDWLSSNGFTTYDMVPMPDGLTEKGKTQRFGFSTSESSARRALTMLTGRTIGRSVITVRLDKTENEDKGTETPMKSREN